MNDPPLVCEGCGRILGAQKMMGRPVRDGSAYRAAVHGPRGSRCDGSRRAARDARRADLTDAQRVQLEAWMRRRGRRAT